MNNPSHIKINKEQSKQRLDKFLVSLDSDKSRSFWQKKILKKEVLVNKKPTPTSTILKLDDEIDIIESKNAEKKIKKIIPNIKIIYEDKNVIVIDKPAGVLAQSAESSPNPSVTDFLIDYIPEIEKVGEEEQRYGTVHRLDKDTSGIMIIAKNNESFAYFKNQFKERLVNKEYTALVYGNITPEKGKIDLNIGRSKKNPQIQTVIDSDKKKNIKSRNALTLYSTIKKYKEYSLLSVEIKTGRMHQIRVHMKAIGYPVVGDKKYNFRKFINADFELNRQFLHANKLSITLPDGIKKTFQSELPEDLKSFLGKQS